MTREETRTPEKFADQKSKTCDFHIFFVSSYDDNLNTLKETAVNIPQLQTIQYDLRKHYDTNTYT